MLIGMKELSEGSRLLIEFLRARGETLNAFCKRKDLDYSQIHRLRAGKRGERMSVNLALAIERATDGAVPMASWAHKQEADELVAAVA